MPIWGIYFLLTNFIKNNSAQELNFVDPNILNLCYSSSNPIKSKIINAFGDNNENY
jgi:hypothetical protein